MARKEERKGDTETKKDINYSNTGRWKHTKNRCMAEGGCWVKVENTKNRGWAIQSMMHDRGRMMGVSGNTKNRDCVSSNTENDARQREDGSCQKTSTQHMSLQPLA